MADDVLGAKEPVAVRTQAECEEEIQIAYQRAISAPALGEVLWLVVVGEKKRSCRSAREIVATWAANTFGALRRPATAR